MSEQGATQLYPRLPHSDAREIAEEYASLAPSKLEERASLSHDRAIFTPTGGGRISASDLKKLKEEIAQIATDLDYPSPFPDSPSQKKRRHFDFAVAKTLHRSMKIVPGEAGKDDVWEFISCVLMPQFVRWRFPGTGSEAVTSLERFLGGDRNTYQRLWWRAEILGSSGDYRLLRELNEDELVQIMERPYLASNRRLAESTAECFVQLVSEQPDVDRMNVMRNAQKRLRRLSPLLSFASLDDADIERRVQATLAESAYQISGVKLGSLEEAESTSASASTADARDAAVALGALLEAELESLHQSLLTVLVDAYPDRLDASEIATLVKERDSSASPTRSDVNRALYRRINSLVEKIGRRPPEWRLDPDEIPEDLVSRCLNRTEHATGSGSQGSSAQQDPTRDAERGRLAPSTDGKGESDSPDEHSNGDVGDREGAQEKADAEAGTEDETLTKCPICSEPADEVVEWRDHLMCTRCHKVLSTN